MNVFLIMIICCLQGMQSARGRKLLFADADGATEFEDLVKLESALELLIKSKVIVNKYFLC